MGDVERSGARRPFRRAAWVMAFVLVGLAWMMALAPIQGKGLAAGACLFVAFVMLTVGATGTWPPPGRRPGSP
ncbi:hypothetical protein [Paludisphaera sp.]|uniref:hypothetical protein n=1 Tax=Paludisphaera sp. TaxID=2017432 RepID=UPI00301B9FC1